MKHAPVLAAIRRASLAASLHSTCRNIILICVLCLPAALPIPAADSYSDVTSKHLALETEVSAAAANPEIADLKRAVMDEVHMLPQAPQGQQVVPVRSKPKSTSGPGVVLAFAGILTFGIVGFLVKRRFDSMISASDLTEDRAKHLLAEDPSLVAFFNELRGGLNPTDAPVAQSGSAPTSIRPHSSQEKSPATTTDLLFEFYASTPGQLANLRKLFSDFTHVSEEAGRQTIILEFLRQIGGLKELARAPEVRPVWLMACAIEGLFKQLSRDTSEVTASVLRTVAGGVDLLEALCARGVNPNLATEPPVHLLAVDDDPISRLAISFALKKAFDTPDLATNGVAALALTEQQTYDVIFLDVDMPDMDGYELCTRIRQTARHRTTPVVFVTRHGDFISRSKSTLSGGESLIAKPFLAFEITVKALTLALRGRLQNGAVKSQPLGEKATPNTALATQATTSPLSKASGDEKSVVNAEMPKEPESQSTSTPQVPDDFNFSPLIETSEDGSPETLFTSVPVYLKQLRDQLLVAQSATGQTDLQKYLRRLCLGIHSFNAVVERAELRAAVRLGSALEGMLNKLLKHQHLCSPSTLNAAAAAIELLEALCSRAGTRIDLTRSNVRILVVDDDPIARRAVSGAIQLVFGRPENAENGNAALALAGEQPFDLIFLDVLMPGIDGFTTCKKIHNAALNRHTPVVFITSSDDNQARSQAMNAGGCGFISKPVLASQITLTTLTFILRARLNKIESPPPEEATVCLVGA